MLTEREREWQKIQERMAEPSVPTYEMVHPKPTVDEGPPVQPYVPESLPYTNNLPLMSQERRMAGEADPQSGYHPHEEHKRELK
jgi:hypothetical protein